MREGLRVGQELGARSSRYFRRTGWTAEDASRAARNRGNTSSSGPTATWPRVRAVFGSDKGAVMGNIFRQEFLDIWHGDRFRQYRRASVSGKSAYAAFVRIMNAYSNPPSPKGRGEPMSD